MNWSTKKLPLEMPREKVTLPDKITADSESATQKTIK
jgi:hypothetical protein